MTAMKLDRVVHNAPMAAKDAAEFLDVGVAQLSELEKNDPAFAAITYRIGAGPKAQRRWLPEELRQWLTRASRNRCSPETPGEVVA